MNPNDLRMRTICDDGGAQDHESSSTVFTSTSILQTHSFLVTPCLFLAHARFSERFPERARMLRRNSVGCAFRRVCVQRTG